VVDMLRRRLLRGTGAAQHAQPAEDSRLRWPFGVPGGL